jgi:catechol 2,3-dioxygenase-like lactoylglutathione lyase family enzyme
MKITGIDHVQLAMPPGGDDRARRFYGEVLGLREVPKPPALAVRGGLWFENDSVRIHLGIENDFRPARKAHPALLVQDLEALAERLREAGYAVLEPEPLSGYDRVHTDDPFGNRIELMEPAS